MWLVATFRSTSSSALAERPRDASCLSVVSFSSTIPLAQFFISYFGCGFISAYNSILFCCLRCNVEPCCHTHDSQTTMTVYSARRDCAWSVSHRTQSRPWLKSATLAGRCRPGSVQSLRPGVQMSVQDGSWIPVYLLPSRLRHLWPSPPAIGWPWSSRLSTCETCFVRRTFIYIRRPLELELTSCLP